MRAARLLRQADACADPIVTVARDGRELLGTDALDSAGSFWLPGRGQVHFAAEPRYFAEGDELSLDELFDGSDDKWGLVCLPLPEVELGGDWQGGDWLVDHLPEAAGWSGSTEAPPPRAFPPRPAGEPGAGRPKRAYG